MSQTSFIRCLKFHKKLGLIQNYSFRIEMKQTIRQISDGTEYWNYWCPAAKFYTRLGFIGWAFEIPSDLFTFLPQFIHYILQNNCPSSPNTAETVQHFRSKEYYNCAQQPSCAEIAIAYGTHWHWFSLQGNEWFAIHVREFSDPCPSFSDQSSLLKFSWKIIAQ